MKGGPAHWLRASLAARGCTADPGSLKERALLLFEQERLVAQALEAVAFQKGKDPWVDRYIRRLLPYLFTKETPGEDAQDVLQKWVDSGPIAVMPQDDTRIGIALPKVDVSTLERVRVRSPRGDV